MIGVPFMCVHIFELYVCISFILFAHSIYLCLAMILYSVTREHMML